MVRPENMPGVLSSALRLGVWVAAALLVAMAAVVQGAGHHHSHPLSLNNRLNMMLDHVDASIWDKKQRLGGEHSYAPDEFDDDGVTIVESDMEAEETQLEDMHDYVNIAPWIRRSQNIQPINIIDKQNFKRATENAQRVKIEGKCEVPQQRCEAIRSSNDADNAVFLPRCALLHRCSEDSGCCSSDDKICGPAEIETVELFFYVFRDIRATIEVMTFVNHTRCACQYRNVVINSCKCPRSYQPVSVDGQCSCDCDITRSRCRRYKKGRRYFSSADVRCVSTGECVAPNCEYGPFLVQQRRCTKRRERERYITNRK